MFNVQRQRPPVRLQLASCYTQLLPSFIIIREFVLRDASIFIIVDHHIPSYMKCGRNRVLRAFEYGSKMHYTIARLVRLNISFSDEIRPEDFLDYFCVNPDVNDARIDTTDADQQFVVTIYGVGIPRSPQIDTSRIHCVRSVQINALILGKRSRKGKSEADERYYSIRHGIYM